MVVERCENNAFLEGGWPLRETETPAYYWPHVDTAPETVKSWVAPPEGNLGKRRF